MSLVESYFKLQQEYEKKYGNSVCVLIQVGKFYELYEYDPSRENQITFDGSNLELKHLLKEKSSQNVGKAVDLSLILNMRLTSKNKDKPHSIENPFMMGFPCPSYESHRDLILSNGYTIVRIDQKVGSVEREVVEISSPGTELSFTRSSNTIVSIYLECTRPNLKNLAKMVMVCGLSSLDICTGVSNIAEIYSKDKDETYALLEIYRFLESQRPIELILHANKVPLDQIHSYKKYLTENLELDRYPIRIVQMNAIDGIYFKESYQESMLHKALGTNYQPGTTNLIDELDLELFQYGRVSYMVLLQYCYEHNEKIIDRLQKPKVGWTDQGKHLILTHNAINQLDLVPKQFNKSKDLDCLASVLDLTCTEIGSRFLRQQLLNPITDPIEIGSRYDMTDELLNHPDLSQKIDLLLKRLPDIEKLQRKSQIGLLRPKEFVMLFNGYFTVQSIYRDIFDHCSMNDKSCLKDLFLSSDQTIEFNKVLTELWTKVDFEKLDAAKIVKNQIQTHESFFIPNRDQEIDQLQEGLAYYQKWLNSICDHFNDLLSGTRGKKIEPVLDRAKASDDLEELEQGDLTIYLYTTPSKANTLKKSGKIDHSICGTLEFQEMRAKSKTLITSEVIRNVIDAIEKYQKALEQKLTSKYNELVGFLGSSKFFHAITGFIARLDLVRTSALLAIRYNYHRPIMDPSPGPSYFAISGMRHPLIERIIRNEYIPNDLELNQTGMILFGVNSTGKTSMIKSPACILIMAQVGLFTPGKLKYRIFKRIITRLSGNDDLLKGQSSFIIEMNEVNTILRNADENTLVIGDELCRGTESLSGTSLTVAMVKTLVDRKCCFMFSTHMHHLPEVDIIKELLGSNKITIQHLTAEYDLSLDQLVYNRKLGSGAGSSLYGLEVCKSLAMDPKFLEYANAIRRELQGIPEQLVTAKTSRYNSSIHMTECFFCKKTFQLQTHHIREQSKADERGYVEHVPINSNYNLLPICQPCHHDLHANRIQIIQQQTLQGVNIKL